MKILHTSLRTALLAALMLIAVVPAMAQPTDATAPRTVADVNDNDDRGFDWGLLGLLGLLGLIPRKQHHVDRDPNRASTSTR